MPLDPHVQRLLGMLAAAGPTGAPPPSLEARREAFAKLMALSDPDVAIGRVDRCAAPGPQGQVPIRIYTPLEAGCGRLPGLVYFHGGGFVAGSLDTHDAVCRTLANEAGCRLVAVDYRLAPEHKFPAAVADCCAAATWVFGNADSLGIALERVAIGGDSAGAALAVAVLQIIRHGKGIRPALQLLLCPILDFGTAVQPQQRPGAGPFVDPATIAQDLECYLPAGVEPTDPRVSPLREPDLCGLPPACIHTAEYDPVRGDGAHYAERLRLAGVAASHTCHPGMTHLFYGMARIIPYARIALRLIGAEIRTALG